MNNIHEGISHTIHHAQIIFYYGNITLPLYLSARDYKNLRVAYLVYVFCFRTRNMVSILTMPIVTS